MISIKEQSNIEDSSNDPVQLGETKAMTVPVRCRHVPALTHTTSNMIIAWLLISLPLVIWDTGFVFLRPLSMPGGSLHWPLWVPYKAYMETDYIYGWKAVEEKNGFTAAQAFMNMPETLLYMVYLYVVYFYGHRLESRHDNDKLSFLMRRTLTGRSGTIAPVVCYTAAIMTLSKTILYGLNEVFSGCSNVGHNTWTNLFVLYFLPNGAWLVASAVMSYRFGAEILERLFLQAIPSEQIAIPAGKEL